MNVPRCAAIGLAVALLAGCSSVQQEADDEAARVADHVLPDSLEQVVAAAGPQTPQDRVSVAREWLVAPDPSVPGSQSGAAWEVREVEGTTIRVDVYRYWESGSFFPPDQGEAAWGVACRSYDVAGPVVPSAVECPEDTPEAP